MNDADRAIITFKLQKYDARSVALNFSLSSLNGHKIYFFRYILNFNLDDVLIVKPKSEVPKSKIPKSRPMGLGMTQ